MGLLCTAVHLCHSHNVDKSSNSRDAETQGLEMVRQRDESFAKQLDAW